MGVLIASFAALSTYYPESKRSSTRRRAASQMHRIIAQAPALAAYAFRHRRGLPIVPPAEDLSFSGNFLAMLFSEPGHAVHAQPGARARARRAVHPARRSRAELQHVRHALRRQLARRPVLVGGRRHGGALRPAARRRERSGAADAERDRLDRPRAGVHHAREGRRRTADGIRPPRLQVVRPARDDHQADGRRGVRGDRAQPAARDRDGARAHRAAGRLLRRRASSTRTWISTPG